MALGNILNPRNYGGDDDPPEHGRDTAIFQELQTVRVKLNKWLFDNRDEFFNETTKAKAEQAGMLLAEVADELNVPL